MSFPLFYRLPPVRPLHYVLVEDTVENKNECFQGTPVESGHSIRIGWNMATPPSSFSLSTTISTPWRIQTIPSFCITLERRLDRWKRFQTQPGVASLPLKRFLGIDGKTLSLSTDDRIATMTKRNIHTKTRRSHEELNSLGGVGCALSHIAVWQWMVDNRQPFCLVFEDDAVVPDDFIPQANHLIQSTTLQDPTTWDMWLLGGTWDDTGLVPSSPQDGAKQFTGLVPSSPPYGDKLTQDRSNTAPTLYRIGSFVLFHAYVMTLPAAERLVRDAYPIHAHIDLWTSVYSYQNHLRVVGAPSLRLAQNPKTPTDIQTASDCALCDIPTTFQDTHRLITHTEYYVGQVAQVTLLLIVGGYFVSHIVRRKG